ncbi:MAG: conjugative transfer signal peptidase TraF [Gammaproteobacteria bacterium]
MKFSSNRITRVIVFLCIFLMLLFALCAFIGIRFNTTNSIPIGFYRIVHMPIEKGAYVIFCPPENNVFNEAQKRGYISAGFCKGGYGYMMKRVAAVKGDSVFISKEGVFVKGKLLPVSKPVIADAAGRPMFRYPFHTFTLKEGEFLLMSDISGTSFDGRYFGPINRAQIKGVIHSIFTWK